MEYTPDKIYNYKEEDKAIRSLQLSFADALERSDPEAIEQILLICFKSIAKFAKIVFPERFRRPFTNLHHQMFELLDDETVQKVVIAFGRGMGKTSIVALAMMARNILYRRSRFIPYVSTNETYAVSQTENLKRKLLTSKVVRALFGSIRTRVHTDMDESFSKKTWIASLPGEDDFQTLVLPRGGGQKIRGLLFGDHRPDFFQIDDLEDDKEIGNPINRKNLKVWFFGPLLGAVSQVREDDVNWRIIYTDTIKHSQSLVEELLSASDWQGLRLSICDSNYKTLVPGFKTDQDIKDLVKQYRDKYEMDVFAREYMCRPVAAETAAFKQEFFQRYYETDKKFIDQRHELRNVVIFDPSRTIGGHAVGTVVWGVNVNTNALFLRHSEARQMHPEQSIANAFDLADRFNAAIVAYEDTGLNEWIDHPVRNEMVRRGRHYELVPLKAKRIKRSSDIKLSEEDGKPGRSGALLPFYRQGQVYHNAIGIGSFELNLMSWPRPAEWHEIDAASYIVPIMDKYTWIFQPTDGGDDPYEFKGEFDLMYDRSDMMENEAHEYFV